MRIKWQITILFSLLLLLGDLHSQNKLYSTANESCQNGKAIPFYFISGTTSIQCAPKPFQASKSKANYRIPGKSNRLHCQNGISKRTSLCYGVSIRAKGGTMHWKFISSRVNMLSGYVGPIQKMCSKRSYGKRTVGFVGSARDQAFIIQVSSIFHTWILTKLQANTQATGSIP